MAPGLPPPITTAAVRIGVPASVVIYALCSAGAARREPAPARQARRDYRPDEVAAWARVQVMTKLGLLVAVTGAPPAWLMIM
jgi:hypothetical protein